MVGAVMSDLFLILYAVPAAITGALILVDAHRSGGIAHLTNLAFFSVFWPVFWLAAIAISLSELMRDEQE